MLTPAPVRWANGQRLESPHLDAALHRGSHPTTLPARREFEEPDGSLFVTKRRKRGLWAPGRAPDHDKSDRSSWAPLLGFGQDLVGEIYVLTTDNTGPTGTTGKVYRLTRPTFRWIEPHRETPQSSRIAVV